ncbi:MAG: hypothetical protein JWM11_7525, partial [Planctomycetaceae bacterium]|nr:hypothetical protein [Planctomycetaceae bacterium]
MIRIVFVILMVISIASGARLSGQDVPKHESTTLEDLIKDPAVSPVGQTVAAVEQALRRTKHIAIRFGDQQVIMPAVDDIPLSKIVAVILEQCHAAPTNKLNAGKKSLLISVSSDNAAALILALVDVQFTERSGRPSQAERDPLIERKVTMPDGLQAQLLESSDKSIERVLRDAEDISIMLGQWNVIVPLSKKSPRLQLATLIGKIVRTTPAIGLLDGRQSLILEPPVANVLDLTKALLEVLTVEDNDHQPQSFRPTNSEAIEPLATQADSNDEVGGKKSAEGRNQIENFAKDVPIGPAVQSAEMIEQVLQETPRITIRFNGQQIIVPLVRKVSLSKVAQAILAESKDAPEITFHKGRTALLISSPPTVAQRLVERVVQVLFIEQGQRVDFWMEPPLDATSIKGWPPKLLELDDTTLERELREAQVLSVYLGEYIVNIPLNEKSPYGPIAREIGKLVKQFPTIHVLKHKKGLKLAPPFAHILPVFSALTVGMTANEPADTSKKPSLFVFELKHVKAEDVKKMFAQLFRDEVKFEADGRTNRLVFQGTQKVLSDVQAVIRLIDHPNPNATNPAVGPQSGMPPGSGVKDLDQDVDSDQPPSLQGTWTSDEWGRIELESTPLEEKWSLAGTFTGKLIPVGKIQLKWSAGQSRYVGTWSRGVDRFGSLTVRVAEDGTIRGAYTNDPKSKAPQFSPELSDLIWKKAVPKTGRSGKTPDSLTTQEQTAEKIALEIRSSGHPNPELKAQLRAAVAYVFAQRQQIHQSELSVFQQRMTKVQQTIQTREQNKDKIIDRRVEDLLNPNLKWESQTHQSQSFLQGRTELEGEWRHQHGRMQVQGHQWNATLGDYVLSYSIVLNPVATPKTIDMINLTGTGSPSSVQKGIYQLDGDTLTTAFNKSGKPIRPAKFEDPEVQLTTWNRIDDRDQSIQIDASLPAGATISVLELNHLNQDVEISKQVLPARLKLDTEKEHRLLLAEIPGDPKLGLSIEFQIPFPTAATRDFRIRNDIPLQFTDDDLLQVRAGGSIIKVMYLPHSPGGNAPASSPQIVVESRFNSDVSYIDVAREMSKHGIVIATANIRKVEIQNSAAGASRVKPGKAAKADGNAPAFRATDTSAVDISAAARTEIRPFDPRRGGNSSAHVGVVRNVLQNGDIVISLVHPGEGKAGDEWDVIRPEGGGYGRRFARMQLIEVQKETAIARVTESTRVLVDNEYVYQKIAVGDLVERPAHSTKLDDEAQSTANLKRLMLALHHYREQHEHFPPATILGRDGKGKVLHSWRVEILPQLGQQKLYDEYHFDEPWD